MQLFPPQIPHWPAWNWIQASELRGSPDHWTIAGEPPLPPHSPPSFFILLLHFPSSHFSFLASLCSLNDVQKREGWRRDQTFLSQILNSWRDVDEIWYKIYVAGGHHTLVTFNFVQSVLSQRQTHEFAAWERNYRKSVTTLAFTVLCLWKLFETTSSFQKLFVGVVWERLQPCKACYYMERQYCALPVIRHA